MQRLTTEPALQPLLAQFVPLELKVDDPEFALWRSRYKPTGNGIPMIFIVAADGREIYNRSGAPAGDGLPGLLTTAIQQTGGFKSPGGTAVSMSDEKLVKALTGARRFLARDEPAAAIALLLPLIEDPAGGSPENPLAAVSNAPGAMPPGGNATGLVPPGAATASEASDPRNQMRKLLAELEQRAQGELTPALQDLEAAENPLVAAVRLLRVERLYGELPGIKTALADGLNRLSAGGDGETLLDQAKMIDKARQYEQRKSKRSAIAAYRKLIAAHPGTQAASLSQQRIDQLSGGSSEVQTAGENPSPRRWSDRSGQYSVLATLVSSDGTHVRIKKDEDGEIVSVPLKILSDECQQYLRSRPH